MENKQTTGGNNPRQPNQPNQPNRKRRFNFMWVYAILFVVLIGLQFIGRDNSFEQTEIDQGRLVELLQSQEIGKIELVNKEDAEIYLNEQGLRKNFPDAQPVGGTTVKPNYTYKIGSLERFEELVENTQEGIDNPVYIKNVSRSRWMSEFLLSVYT